MRSWALLLIGCGTAQHPQPTPVQSVSVAPQSTGSPNEPVLLVGPQPKAFEPSGGGDIERVKVTDAQLDASWKPPKDRCPEGVTEMIAVHVPIGETMELAPGAAPVSALGGNDAVDVMFYRTRKIVRIIAKKQGLVFVLTERERKCTWYGVNSGY